MRMGRMRRYPKISRDEERIRQVEQGSDYAPSKRDGFAGWEVCLAECETCQGKVHWKPTVAVITGDHLIRLDTSCLMIFWRDLR